jgi:hypothetical protein
LSSGMTKTKITKILLVGPSLRVIMAKTRKSSTVAVHLGTGTNRSCCQLIDHFICLHMYRINVKR